MTDTITELIVKEVLEKDVAKSDACLVNTKIDYDSINELSKKIFMELQYNTFGGMKEEDVVDHIVDFLGILDLINIATFDTYRLSLNIFPLSLTGDAGVSWSNGKNYVANNHNKDGPGYYELMAWMDSRHNDKRIDQMTKSTLCHAWVYGWGNDESADDIVSSNEEWEESDYGNPPNTNDDSFLEPYLDAHNKNTKQSERNRMKCNCDTSELEKVPHPNNMNDVQPNGRMCKAEKFEVIKYSLGPNEESLL
ncbi:hypothetical protein Tco_0912241 [Tanacetum coccineum]